MSSKDDPGCALDLFHLFYVFFKDIPPPLPSMPWSQADDVVRGTWRDKINVPNIFLKGESYRLSISTNILKKKISLKWGFLVWLVLFVCFFSTCFHPSSQTRLNHKPPFSPLRPSDSILAQVLSIISKLLLFTDWKETGTSEYTVFHYFLCYNKKLRYKKRWRVLPIMWLYRENHHQYFALCFSVCVH